MLVDNQSRLTHIDDITIAKPVFEGAGYVSPFEITWCRKGLGSHAKKGVRSAAPDTRKFRFSGDRVDHLFNRGLASTVLKVTEHRVEEMRKKRESFDSTTNRTPGNEFLSVDFLSVGTVPFPLFGEPTGFDEVEFNLGQEIIVH